MVSDLLKVTWLVQRGTDICTQALKQLIFIWKTTFLDCQEADAGEPGPLPSLSSPCLSHMELMFGKTVYQMIYTNSHCLSHFVLVQAPTRNCQSKLLISVRPESQHSKQAWLAECQDCGGICIHLLSTKPVIQRCQPNDVSFLRLPVHWPLSLTV